MKDQITDVIYLGMREKSADVLCTLARVFVYTFVKFLLAFLACMIVITFISKISVWTTFITNIAG